ncbi:MAG TPA: hypothetical protein VNL95_01580 [Dehalococcoidia bacterium]|nr:hypothetical protein [Dehalococcoidia bacterium]
MVRTLLWPLRHDPWLDNGLERWGCLLQEVSRQHPKLLRLEWRRDGLLVELQDVDALVPIVDDALERQLRPNLFYTYVNRRGERGQRLLDFIGFNQQPPKQWPQLYLSDAAKRQHLLRAALSGESGGSRACPLCGSPLGRQPPTLTLSVYPLVTKNKAFSGARTLWTGNGFEGRPTNVPVCHRCYLLGALTWADEGLLYLCGLGPDRSLAVAVLPAPPTADLLGLHRQKEQYRGQLRHERLWRTNVYYRPASAASSASEQEEQDEEEAETAEAAGERPVREGRFSLLLAFLERCLKEVADKGPGEPFQIGDVRRQVPNGWLFISMPQGRMKNVTVHDLVLDEPTLQLLVRLVEMGIEPYAHVLAQIGLTDDRGRPLGEMQANMREAMAQGLLSGNFVIFARAFLPRPRQQLRLYGALEGPIQAIVTEWRWRGMEEQLETVRKAGYALAEIAASRRQPVILYNLERVRTRSDLLSTLKEAVHRLIGLGADDMRYISVAALEDLVQLAHRDTVPFEDLKNTLFVFAGVAYARKVIAQARSQQGGEGDA